MNLRDAALCLDCEEIVPLGAQACAACASTQIQRLTTWVPAIELEEVADAR